MWKLQVKLGVVEEQRTKLELAYSHLLQDNEENKRFEENSSMHVCLTEDLEKTLLGSHADTEKAILITSKNQKITGKECLGFSKLEFQVSHFEITQSQIHSEIMQKEMVKMLIIMEERLTKAEALWRKEKMEILLELNKVKLDAVWNIQESDKILQNFQEGQEMMKEAKQVVYSLLCKQEKRQKLKIPSLPSNGSWKEHF